MSYRITFINITSGKREVYLNNTDMGTQAEALKEIRRLERHQQEYEDKYWPRTRKDFIYEKIKRKK